MSVFVTAELRCRCEHTRSVSVAESIHASARPDLRDAVLDGSFHVFGCPACARNSTVEKVFTYTDFERRQWFTVVPPINLATRGEWLAFSERSFAAVFIERAAPLVKTWAPNFTRRVVFGLASLREKLLAFEEGLDDRRLEQLKLDLIADGTVPYAVDSYFHLARATPTELLFAWSLPGDSSVEELVIPRTRYEEPVHASASVLHTSPIVDLRVLYVPEQEPPAA